MRNPNGYGSVHQLPGRRRRPWVARVTTGWTSEGKQERQVIGYFETKKDALAALALHQVSPVSPKANVTLGQMHEEWAAAKYEYVTRPTIDNYKASWKYLSRFANVKVRDLRTAHLQSVIDSCHKDGLSRSSLEKIRSVATMLFSYAVENDIVSKNYAQFIKLPKSEKRKKDRFSDLEVRKIEGSNIDWADTILIMIYTGMRISEMLGLTKFNINLEKGIITGGIKTDAGKDRVIPIHKKILPHITKWYNRGGDYLICNSEGGKLSPDWYRKRRYYPALESIGVRRLNPHCCRHTFASMLDEAGISTAQIQQLVGHSDYATTANIYTHTDVEVLKAAVSKI